MTTQPAAKAATPPMDADSEPTLQRNDIPEATPAIDTAAVRLAWHDAWSAADAHLSELLPKMTTLSQEIERLHEGAAVHDRRLAEELTDARWSLHDFLHDPDHPDPRMRHRILALISRDLVDFQRQLVGQRSHNGTQRISRHPSPSDTPTPAPLPPLRPSATNARTPRRSLG